MNMKLLIGIVTLLILIMFVLCQPLLADNSASNHIQSKLNALEKAHEAGILSDKEYAIKKAELQSQLQAATPKPDEITQRKLKALEDAHKAGILSDEEYARKKAELIGRKPEENLEYRDLQGRFRFSVPQNFTVQAFPNGQGVNLRHGQASVNVMLFPGKKTARELLSSITKPISKQWQNYREMRRGERKVCGQIAPLVELTGVNPQGMQARSLIVVFVDSNTGYVLLLTSPEKDFGSMQPEWERLINSFKVGDILPTKKKGKIYRHVIGFSFWYPEHWKVQELEEGLQLVPPNPASNAEGATELYFVAGESVAGEGIYRPDDPRVIEYLGEQVRTMFPSLQRTGNLSFIDMVKGKGIVLDWQARTPRGDVIGARVFASIIKDYGVMLIAIGIKEKLGTRDSDLRQMFASFGFGAAQRDTQLVGSWSLVSTHSIRNESPFETDWSKAKMVSETNSVLVFQADGTWTRTDDYQMLAGAGGLWIDSTEKTVNRGRWYAGEGLLHMIWEDNSWEDYKYEVKLTEQDRQLKRISGQSGETWKRVE